MNHSKKSVKIYVTHDVDINKSSVENKNSRNIVDFMQIVHTEINSPDLRLDFTVEILI